MMRLLLFLLLFGCGRSLYGEGFALPEARDPLSGMGVNIHFTDARPGELEMLSRAGFHWVRMDFTWAATEKMAGVYDFSAYDRLLNSLDRFHIRALFILDYGNDLYDGGMSPHTDEGRAAFARWAAAAVTHFKNRGVIWEIWNEPNGGNFWKPVPNADDYAKLALAASKAIHGAAPDEVIVGPALSGLNRDFVEVAARAGVLAYWSAITIHPYIWTGPEKYGVDYEQMREIIKTYAPPGRAVAVMCGESGFSSAWAGIGDETQGKYLARLLLFDVLSNVPLTIWYDWHDDGNNPSDYEANFGIVNFDYHLGAANIYDPKPAYNAAQTYFHELDGYRFSGRLKTDSGDDYVLRFTKGASTCLVAWTAAPAPHEVKIVPFPAVDLDPEVVYRVTSYDGKKESVVQEFRDVITLTLDGGPQYLKSP